MTRAGGIRMRLGVLGIASTVLLLVACAGETGENPSRAAAGTPPIPENAVEIDVELGDLWVKAERLAVPADTPVVLHVTNVGHMPHDLKLDGQGTKILGRGQSETVTFGPLRESVRLVCTVPGHEAAGMTLDLHVE